MVVKDDVGGLKAFLHSWLGREPSGHPVLEQPLDEIQRELRRVVPQANERQIQILTMAVSYVIVSDANNLILRAMIVQMEPIKLAIVEVLREGGPLII